MATIGFIGLGNMGAPMAANLVKAGHTVTGFDLVPAALRALTDAGGKIAASAAEAVKGADAVYTDVWVSMSDDESSAAARREALHDYAITDELLDHANDGAIALHCLPAHPGEEITEAVLYGDRQRIWDQAENRRHAQKALLELLVSPGEGEG